MSKKGLVGRVVDYLGDIRMADPHESKTKLAVGWGSVAALTGAGVAGAAKLATYTPTQDANYLRELAYYTSHTVTAPPELTAKLQAADPTGEVGKVLGLLALGALLVYGVAKNEDRIREGLGKFTDKVVTLDDALGETFDKLTSGKLSYNAVPIKS